MAGANRLHRPRRGSLQYWPRKRAKRPYARIRNWAELDSTKLLAFLGYKTGMAHAMVKDINPNSPTKNMEISIPVTIVECPPIKPLSIRFYKNTTKGLMLISEVFSEKQDKELKRRAKLPKSPNKTCPEQFDEVRFAIYTQPKLTAIGKKKPEIIEIGISGKTAQEKLEYAKLLLNREIKISELFKENQVIDIHGITKGKGFQGTVKRFGVKIRQHKSEKTKRGVGTLGSWTPKRVQFSVPQAGKMGWHQRTEYNKSLIKIDSKDITPKSGFLKYGKIKNEYVLIHGSVPGSRKKAVIMTEPIRPAKPKQIQFISLMTK